MQNHPFVRRVAAGRATRRLCAQALAILMLAIAPMAPAMADDEHDDHDDHDDDSYAIGLWGDLPYSPAQATLGVPNLIADMNAHRLAFTAHDGDLKAGSGSPCDDALYTQALGYSQGQRLENFTRVETFGNNQANGTNDVQWLKVGVDPRSREVFSYQPMIVPGNRTAVPAP